MATEFTPFGKAAKLRMMELGFSQLELADLVGCSSPYLSKIFSGERSGKKYIDKIKRILKMEN